MTDSGCCQVLLCFGGCVCAASGRYQVLDAGQEFEELPTSYINFITENDIWGSGRAIYPINRVNEVTGKAFEDRQHIMYVNASYKGDNQIGELMHDFMAFRGAVHGF